MTKVIELDEPYSFTDCKPFCGKSSGRCQYFLYGSNLNLKQLQARCSRPKALGVARLPNHRIGFYGYSKIWDGAIETAVPEPGHDLWGVIYELSYSDGEQLDSWQDARLDGSGAYFHYPTSVVDVSGNRFGVILYKKDIQETPQTPSREYLDFILQGVREQNLPEEFIQELQKTATHPATYPVPKTPKFNLGLLGGHCSDCQKENP